MLDFNEKEKQIFDLIILSMSSFSEWEKGVVNRNRLILEELQKRSDIGKVFMVDFLPFTLKRAIRNYFQNIIFGIKGKIIYQGFFDRCIQYKNIYIYSTIESLWSEKRFLQKIKYLTERLEFQNILLWSYQPMFVDCFGKMGEKISVFDTVDNWMENIHFKKYKKRLKKNYSHIAKKANFIFTVAEDLLLFYKNLSRDKKILWIPNGVQMEHFQRFERKQKYDEIFQKLQKPIIGYIGTIQNRVDFSLINTMAKLRPSWTFVLVGPTWPVYFKKFRPTPKEFKNIKKNKNVILLGPISYTYIPQVIRKFQVGVIPHKIDLFVRSMNPMKMYDYLACGKPVVSTLVPGIEFFENFIAVAQTANEFIEKIETALREDSSCLQNARKNCMREHTYQKRVEKMLSYIK